MREWQPIETAPLDKWVLFWWRPINDNRYAETVTMGQVSSHEVGKWWDLTGKYQDLWHVTHWMPLPPAPNK